MIAGLVFVAKSFRLVKYYRNVFYKREYKSISNGCNVQNVIEIKYVIFNITLYSRKRVSPEYQFERTKHISLVYFSKLNPIYCIPLFE